MPDGGYLLVKALKRNGVQFIFTLSGLQTQSIYNACIDEGIRLIDTRHEQTAVFMADAWARTTGHPGVALLSAGPGLTNGITGIINAFSSSSPAIIIAGKSPLSESGKGAFQEVDQLLLVKPITKWAASITDASEITEYVNAAFNHATSGTPGPTYVDIPVDILNGEINKEVTLPTNGSSGNAESSADSELLKQSFEIFLGAKRPMILAGSGIRWADAGDHLKDFIDITGIPLVTIDMAKGVIPDDHPLCFGPVWSGLVRADAVLICGTSLDYRLSYGQPPTFNKHAKIIQIACESQELGESRSTNITGSQAVSFTLSQLSELAKQAILPDYSSWVVQCEKYLNEHQNEISKLLHSDSIPIHPLRLCNEIKDFLDRDTTIVVDGGDTTVFGKAALKAYYPGRWLDVGPLWCIGVGVPFGLAAKLARPDKQVLILSGDGSFGYGVFEYNTAVRHNIPIVSVVNNDGAWGMIKHDQQELFGRDRVMGTELGITRYDKIVRALGGYGEYVVNLDQIQPALKRAFSSGLPACINVRVDPTATSKGIFAAI